MCACVCVCVSVCPSGIWDRNDVSAVAVSPIIHTHTHIHTPFFMLRRGYSLVSLRLSASPSSSSRPFREYHGTAGEVGARVLTELENNVTYKQGNSKDKNQDDSAGAR